MRTNARAMSKIESDLEVEFKREAGSPIKIGRLLVKAKELLDAHGDWLTWLNDHFPHARRTAQNYMAAAKFADKYATVAHLKLTPGALYELAGIDNDGDGELVQAVLARAETAWIDRDGVGAIAEELRQPPASDHDNSSEPPALPPPPPDSGPPPAPPPAITPKRAALVEAFDKAVEAFKPLLAKRATDFIASSKPDHALVEIANLLAQVVAARQPATDEPKQIAPPTRPPASSPTITLGADEYSEQPAPSDARSRFGELVEFLPKHSVPPSAPRPMTPEAVGLSEHERKAALAAKEEVGIPEGSRLSQLAAPADPVAAFLAKGGTVTQCPPDRRRKVA